MHKSRGSAFTVCARLDFVRKNKGDVLRGEHLDSLSPGEKAAVNGVHNRLGGDLPSAKVSAIEALDGILATLDAVELQVDISLGTGI